MMNSRFSVARMLSSFICLALLATPATADQVTLTDGTVLIGTVQGLTGGVLQLNTAFSPPNHSRSTRGRFGA